MSITNDRLLIVQLADWLNRNKADIPLDCPVLIDDHSDTGEALWLQPLTGTKITKQYVCGDYIGSIAFAAYFQYTNPEAITMLDVPLWNLGEFFENNSPQLEIGTAYKVEMTGTPTGFYRGEDGTHVNQAIFAMTYRKDVTNE